MNTLESNSFVDAIKNGRNEEVNNWLDLHPKLLNSVFEYGMTPLHYAARHGPTSTVELLLRRQGDDRRSEFIDAKALFNWTPLHYAVSTQQESNVIALLRFGSKSVNTPDVAGWSPFRFACYRGYNAIFRILQSVGGVLKSKQYLTGLGIKMPEEPLTEEEIVEIRFRVYFNSSLFDQLCDYL